MEVKNLIINGKMMAKYEIGDNILYLKVLLAPGKYTSNDEDAIISVIQLVEERKKPFSFVAYLNIPKS